MELVSTTIAEQRPLKHSGEPFPTVLRPMDPQNATAASLVSWCQRNHGKLRNQAMCSGAVLLRGFNVSGSEDFAAVTRALGCEDYDYIGGAAPRTELVPGVVFTANEAPPNSIIPFHHELAQAPNPPQYILFHCERPATTGGATPIIPSAEVASFFERTFPEFARKIETLGVRYVRVMPQITDTSSAQGRSWKETYNATTKEEAEAAMRSQGTSFEWLPNGDCRTITVALPALRMDSRTGRKIFFNSVVAAFTGWNDSRNVGEKAVLLGDGSSVDANALRAVAEFMHQHRVAFPWQAGDVLLIDNNLVMHSRDRFEGSRRVLAALRGPPLIITGIIQEMPPTVTALAAQAPLRICILGAGAMGKEHICNIRLLGENVAVVVAVVDPNELARAEAMQALGTDADRCEVYADDLDAISCDSVDALVICTPNYTHIDILRRCIGTNKHILCEKPLCTTVADCEEVERLLEERDVRLRAQGRNVGIFMTGMEYRWMPPIAQLIQEVESGKYGKVHHVSIREHRHPFLVKVNNWNRFNRYTGGMLVEKGCHFFDLMRLVVGSDPVSVYASGEHALNHKFEVYDEGSPDMIDHAFAVVQFANGARASLDICMFAEDEQAEYVTAVCELGKIEARSPESTVRVVQRRSVHWLGRKPPGPEERAVPEVHDVPVPSVLANAGQHEGATFFELRAFVEAAKGCQPVPVSAHDGTMAVAMGKAAQESIRLGEVVWLNGHENTTLLQQGGGVQRQSTRELSTASSVAARGSQSRL